MEDCNAMHKCWTIGPLCRQKLTLAYAKAYPVWDFAPELLYSHEMKCIVYSLYKF